jgi:hypothetical protein
MHIADYDIEEIVLQSIRNGECEPVIFGSIIDKDLLENKQKKTSLYGTWKNISNDRIIDVLHLNERRIAIGMPTMEMERKRNELLKKRDE